MNCLYLIHKSSRYFNVIYTHIRCCLELSLREHPHMSNSIQLYLTLSHGFRHNIVYFQVHRTAQNGLEFLVQLSYTPLVVNESLQTILYCTLVSCLCINENYNCIGSSACSWSMPLFFNFDFDHLWWRKANTPGGLLYDFTPLYLCPLPSQEVWTMCCLLLFIVHICF